MVATSRAKVAAAQAKVAQARSMVVAAQARLEAAREKLDQAKAMEVGALRKRDAMAAMAAQGRAMQRTAEVVRDYVNIRSSGAGYVVKRLVAPGVLVQPGMAILKVAQIDRVRLQANVGERDLASIRVGSAVRIMPTGTGQPPITAPVTSEASVEASQKGLQQAGEDFRVVKERFEAGRGIQVEVLDAQVALTRARFNAVSALAEHGAARAMWLRATGRTR
jgi:multidrug efflux pump subunit AcrA (membrane-fusion protein)